MTDRSARRKRVHFAIDRLPWWLWPIADAAQWISCRVFSHEPITHHSTPSGAPAWFCAYCLTPQEEPSRG